MGKERREANIAIAERLANAMSESTGVILEEFPEAHGVDIMTAHMIAISILAKEMGAVNEQLVDNLRQILDSELIALSPGGQA